MAGDRSGGARFLRNTIQSVPQNKNLLKLIIFMYESNEEPFEINVCPVKIRSKHSSNTLLRLLRIFTGQTLVSIELCCFKLGKWFKLGLKTSYAF